MGPQTPFTTAGEKSGEVLLDTFSGAYPPSFEA